MPINAPAYNPELNTDQSGRFQPQIVKLEKYVQKPQQKNDERNLPFISLASQNGYELSTEIKRKKVQDYLHEYIFKSSSLDKLCENEPFLDDLFFIQSKVSSYFTDYILILDYFIDPEEEIESFNVIIKTKLDIIESLDLEDLFFDEIFDKIYTISEGKITLKVEPNGI